MNLRQKVKKAKGELKELQKRNCSSTWEIFEKIQQEQELQKLINHKRKRTRPMEWNEERHVDTAKLTFISFFVGYKELDRVVSGNGTPLSRDTVERFLRESGVRFIEEAKKVAGREPSKRKKITYGFYISDDRTRAKLLKTVKLYTQYVGSDNLCYVGTGDFIEVANECST